MSVTTATNEKAVITPAPGEVLASANGHGIPDVVYERDNFVGSGLKSNAAYEAQMGPIRSKLRRLLVRNLEHESRWIAKMQAWIRRPFLDTYFVYTSTLGTHTFFMTMLPAFFFFGHDEAGRGLIHVIGVGVYIASLIKDSVCSPRPFAPPVTRLTIGTHHLEYGFPSTHSTNSVSIALHFFALLSAFKHTLPHWTYVLGVTTLLWYAFSIVFGRLYCAMHSFTDCIVGVALGTSVWATQSVLGPTLDAWMKTPGWQVPVITMALCLLLVNQHPDPVDDCPCFEDSIAFLAVLAGSTLATWFKANWGYDLASGFHQTSMPSDWPMWIAIAAAKLVIGIALIFIWRLIAKPVLHAILPPIFRGLSTLFILPNRRFYTPATVYENFPQQPLLYHPIPSVIDLPGMLNGENEAVLLPTSAGNKKIANGGLKLRKNGAAVKMKEVVSAAEEAVDAPKVAHYDADVLTKVMVYVGIAFIAIGLTPILFERIGLPVHSTLP